MKIKKGMKKEKSMNRVIFVLLSIIVILAALVTIALINRDNKLNSTENNFNESGVLKNFTTPSTIIMHIPAVDSNDTGYMTELKVEAFPGTGRTLVDINGLLFWEDTQQSIRKAKDVAEKISQVNTSNVDLVYTINANASLIGGESAGAALTIATITVLENLDIKGNVIITGTINHDGTIGPVQGVSAKAKAAKDFGAELFLVPLSQSQAVSYETQKHCDIVNGFEVCTTEQIPKKTNITQDLSLDVIEVGTIQEALKYFLKQF